MSTLDKSQFQLSQAFIVEQLEAHKLEATGLEIDQMSDFCALTDGVLILTKLGSILMFYR